jgi:hypothetical protein
MSDILQTDASQPPFDLDHALQAIHDAQDTADWERYQQERSGTVELVDVNFQHGVRAVELGKSEIKGLRPKDPDYIDRLNFERDRIAEGYALQGQFEKAVEWAVKRKDEYRDILDAFSSKPCHKEAFAKQHLYPNKTLFHCPKCGNSYVQ